MVLGALAGLVVLAVKFPVYTVALFDWIRQTFGGAPGAEAGAPKPGASEAAPSAAKAESKPPSGRRQKYPGALIVGTVGVVGVTTSSTTKLETTGTASNLTLPSNAISAESSRGEVR